MTNVGGFLYAVGAEGTALVKIGSAKNVKQRLKMLQTGQPFPLHVLACIEVEADVRRIERQIHTFLADARRRGEWFAVSIDADQLAKLIVRARAYLEEHDTHPAFLHDEGLSQADCVGEQIRKLRVSQKLTLRELADLADVHQSTLSAIETGARAGMNITLGTGTRLARALGVSLDVIAGTYTLE